jgi:hypothetical protein
MAMNKKEQAEMESLRKELLLAPHMPKPGLIPHQPIKIPEHFCGQIPGWCFNVHSREVKMVWRTTVGTDFKEQVGGYTASGTREAYTIYHTKREAYLAMYCELQRIHAGILADVWTKGELDP